MSIAHSTATLLDSLQNKEVECRLIERYLNDLSQRKKLAINSRQAYRRDLLHFQRWLAEKEIEMGGVDASCINRYLIWRTQNGLKRSSTARAVSSLKGFYRWLAIEKIIDVNPCVYIRPPKKEQQFEPVLSAQQVELLLTIPDSADELGIRDKAMMELLYATGLNVSELLSLKLDDLNLGKLTLLVKRKEQLWLIPFGVHAQVLLKQYLDSARKNSEKKGVVPWLFLSRRGEQMSRQAFWYRIKIYAKKAMIAQVITPQSLRKAFAVHLLQSGGAVELVQYMMGHVDQTSTDRYRNYHLK